MDEDQIDAAEAAEAAESVARERERLAVRSAALELTLAELVAAADLEPPDDEHDPDGTTAYERAQVSSLLDITRAQLHQLDEAAARVQLGTFGRCERCGGPIGTERQSALPGTPWCARCAR